jgi:hypothetical protein
VITPGLRLELPGRHSVWARRCANTDSIDDDACDAAPSAAGADTAEAAAEPRKYIKGRLKAKLAFWKLFCTSAWVLSWITDGYQIPWGEMGLPPPHAFANQQGALRHHDFATGKIADLLSWPGVP